MQTVNFNCSHCGKTMAVGLNLLGRNVRCPHCKQVMQAPASADGAMAQPAPSALQTISTPLPNLPPVKQGDSHASIFGEAPSEDLFGDRPPQVKLPSDPNPMPFPVPASLSLEATSPPVDRYAQEFPATIDMPRPPEPAPSHAPATQQMSQFPEPGPDADAYRETSEEPAEREYASHRAEAREGGGGGGMFVWMLLLYALVATGAAAYLFYDKTQSEAKHQADTEAGKMNPFLAIPDFFGEYERADRKKPIKLDGMPAGQIELPKQLQVKLLDSLTVGHLEVTPMRVEAFKPTRYQYRRDNKRLKETEMPGPVYVLYLRLKNVSEDVSFHPNDPAFQRTQRKGPEEISPYSGVVIGKDFFLGGPFPWPDEDYERQYFEGQENDHLPLGPGEERFTAVCTHPNYYRDIEKKLSAHQEGAAPVEVQWRVQLRTGLVKAKDGEGREHDISISSVIGVMLDATQIHVR